jgi:phosphatidylglycerophosphate synthase
MPLPPGPFSFFRKSLKSDSYYADELVNIYLLRPVAAVIVWLIYPTGVTPNQVTLFAVLLGCLAGFIYTAGTPSAIAIAGVLILLKDIFDDADGQLARAKEKYSRRGRFLDSVGDFVVDAVVFAGVSFVCVRQVSHWYWIAGIAGFLGITLRVSYHVFYQVSFLHLEERYKLNRITEEITDEDREGDPVALVLQKIFIGMYGWQDRMMYRLDCWCRGRNFDEQQLPLWYSDRFALRLSGLMGFGTEILLLAICSWFNALPVYFWLNIILMNFLWLCSIFYRKYILSPNCK